MIKIRFVTLLLLVHQAQCNAFQKPPTSSIFERSLKQRSSPLKQVIAPPAQTRFRNGLPISFPSRGGSAMFAVDPNLPAVVFDNAPLVLSTTIFALTNILGFIISIFTGSHVHLDLLGTGAFTLAALPGLLSPSSSRTLLSSGAVAIWGTKLASFLFYRAMKVKTDSRLVDTLSTASGTAGFWFISFIWGVFCSLPHTLGSTSSSAGSPITLAIGSVVYVLGLATETKADYQKWMFKKQNPGQFCNQGLWSVSQHPNFFGNLLLWAGIFIMNADSLIGSVSEEDSILSALSGSWRAWIALLSPLFMWALFSGQSSGAITNSLKLANEKYGSDASYNQYVKNVPLIIPRLFEWLKSLFS